MEAFYSGSPPPRFKARNVSAPILGSSSPSSHPAGIPPPRNPTWVRASRRPSSRPPIPGIPPSLSPADTTSAHAPFPASFALFSMRTFRRRLASAQGTVRCLFNTDSSHDAKVPRPAEPVAHPDRRPNITTYRRDWVSDPGTLTPESPSFLLEPVQLHRLPPFSSLNTGSPHRTKIATTTVKGGHDNAETRRHDRNRPDPVRTGRTRTTALRDLHQDHRLRCLPDLYLQSKCKCSSMA